MTGPIARAELAGHEYAELQERRLAALKAGTKSQTKGGAMPDSISAIEGAKTEDRPSIIKEFEWAITDLQSVVEELYSRLAPVVRREPESDPPSEVIIPTSDARANLYALQGSTGSLRSLISRLEV